MESYYFHSPRHKLNQKPMLKTILLSVIVAMTLGTSTAYATEVTEPNTTDVQSLNEIEITVEGHNIRIRGAEGERLEIFSVTGRRIAVFSIDSPDKVITLTMNGCFIVKVKNTTRKVTLS